MKIAGVLALAIALPLGGCTKATFPVDRHNPESVLRAYFAAWEKGDWAKQKSFMADKYITMQPEPINSLQILHLKKLLSSPIKCQYKVSFEVAVKGHGVSMNNGRYDWSYELTWDEPRQSWFISNYGAG